MCSGVQFLQCLLRVRTLLRRAFFVLFLTNLHLNICLKSDQILSKNRLKIDENCILEQNSHSEAVFRQFWFTFFDLKPILQDFGEAMGGPGAAFFVFFCIQKTEQNLSRFLGAFL